MKYQQRSAVAIVVASLVGGTGAAVAVTATSQSGAQATSTEATTSTSSGSGSAQDLRGRIQELLAGTDRMNHRIVTARKGLASQAQELRRLREQAAAPVTSVVAAPQAVQAPSVQPIAPPTGSTSAPSDDDEYDDDHGDDHSDDHDDDGDDHHEDDHGDDHEEHDDD